MTAHITDLTQLSWYGVSSETGFVPDLVTASSLPSHFALVEGLTSDPPLAEAISLSILREKVHALPQYQLENYAQLSLSEKRRLLVILTFVAHGYVWGNGDDLIMNRLPESIAIPLEYLSKDLGTAPLGTYASTVLWNSRLKNDAKNWSLDNVSIDFTFTGTKDEIWFYQVSACIEAAGGKALSSLLLILLETRREHPDLRFIRQSFVEAQTSLDGMWATLRKVSRMNAVVFSERIRPYFGGWQFVEPQGVHYAGVDEPSVYRTYVGISAAQSSLFQAFDIILDISHNGPGADYLRNARAHMPFLHRQFLDHLEADFSGTLKAFVIHQTDLAESYNRCIQILANFRVTHRGLAQRYAVEPAYLTGRPDFGLAKHVESGGVVYGAGGTHIRKFLGTIADETRSASIN